jgi:hypothetical protein
MLFKLCKDVTDTSWHEPSGFRIGLVFRDAATTRPAAGHARTRHWRARLVRLERVQRWGQFARVRSAAAGRIVDIDVRNVHAGCDDRSDGEFDGDRRRDRKPESCSDLNARARIHADPRRGRDRDAVARTDAGLDRAVAAAFVQRLDRLHQSHDLHE